jgi:anaerobic selenocysteine-containing dehydrogenase
VKLFGVLQQSRAAAMADEWVPIRPATDGALFMAIMNVLVHEAGIYDEHYLRVHTNGGYLIGQDGYFLRDAESGKPLVWDARSNQARAYDDPALSVDDIALLGTFRTDVGEGRPGFQLLHDHLRAYTPEWAEVITSVLAAWPTNLGRPPISVRPLKSTARPILTAQSP